MLLHIYYLTWSSLPSYQAANITTLHFTNEKTDTQKPCLKSQWVAGFGFPCRSSAEAHSWTSVLLHTQVPCFHCPLDPISYHCLKISHIVHTHVLSSISSLPFSTGSFPVAFNPLNLFHFKTVSCTSSHKHPELIPLTACLWNACQRSKALPQSKPHSYHSNSSKKSIRNDSNDLLLKPTDNSHSSF